MPAADCSKCVIRPVNTAAVNLLPCLPETDALLVGIVVYAGEVALPVLVVVKFRVHCLFVYLVVTL